MELKDQIIFLVNVRKKLEKLNNNADKVNNTFIELLTDLNTSGQISPQAIEIVKTMYDIEGTTTKITKVVNGDPCTSAIRIQTRC